MTRRMYLLIPLAVGFLIGLALVAVTARPAGAGRVIRPCPLTAVPHQTKDGLKWHDGVTWCTPVTTTTTAATSTTETPGSTSTTTSTTMATTTTTAPVTAGDSEVVAAVAVRATPRYTG